LRLKLIHIDKNGHRDNNAGVIISAGKNWNKINRNIYLKGESIKNTIWNKYFA